MIMRTGDVLGVMAPRQLFSASERPLTEVKGQATRGSWNELTIELSFYDRDGLAQVVSWPTKIRVAEPFIRRSKCTKKHSKKS